MVSTQALFDVAEQHQIAIVYHETTHFNGLYVFNDDVQTKPLIILNRTILQRPVEHRAVLAEEIGHALTLPGGQFFSAENYGQRVQLGRAEYRAKRWAVQFLVTNLEFFHLVSKRLTPVEMAEELVVPEEFIHLKIDLLKQTEIEREVQVCPSQVHSKRRAIGGMPC